MLKTNDLVGYKNRKIIQSDDMLHLSLDSLILSNFVNIKQNVENILDLGTGIGVIPLIISLRTKAHIDGVEIQKEVFDLACKNINLNSLNNQVKIYNDDIRNYKQEKYNNFYDIIVCNPPFFKEGILSSNETKVISRHEIDITLEEIFQISKFLLKNKGSLAIVFRTERLTEVIDLYRKYNIEPKRIRFIHHKKDKFAKLFFIEGIKNGAVGLKVEPPFILYDEKGETLEYNKLLSEVK